MAVLTEPAAEPMAASAPMPAPDAIAPVAATAPIAKLKRLRSAPGARPRYGIVETLCPIAAVEAWRDDELVGGLYGLALGRVFFGESMFARAADASKVCLAALVALLQQQNGGMIDCQQETTHLASLGARPIRRSEFARRLGELIHSSAAPAGWTPGRIVEHG